MNKIVLIVILLSIPAMAQIAPSDFISNFESGNIANVQQIGIDSFTFEIRLDSIHGDTYGWYYFGITGNEGRTATLFLTNPDSWQNETCNPIFSPDNIHWGRIYNVWRFGNWIGFRQNLLTDTVWIAQDFPFTVSQFSSFIDTLASSPYLSQEVIGYSVHNRPIDLITITDQNVSPNRKKTVWLISRQHPMESPATFLLHGLINFVLSDSNLARWWREDIILKTVPIVNVDGVAEGFSRQNADGINLNRDWHNNLNLEEPEVRAVHQAIENYFSNGDTIDFFMDLHSSMDNNDFGYRISESYTDSNYFQNQGTYLHLLETYDPWQDHSRWRDLDTSYGFGVAPVVLYDMHRLDGFSSETPWTRREDGSFITIQSLIDQGPKWAYAIYNYIYPLTVMDVNLNRIDEIYPGQSFFPEVLDYDQRNSGSLALLAYCPESMDSETVVLLQGNNDGLFYPIWPIHTNESPAVPGDGIVSLVRGGEMWVTYFDPGMPSRICGRVLHVISRCQYIPGDINDNGSANGIDVVYFVNYLKRGFLPPDSCDCPPNGNLFVAADANGNCVANGVDITYMVNYFKGSGDTLRACPDCPPNH